MITNLGLREIQGFRQFFSLLPHHILVLLKSLLKFQQLAGGEGCADSLWFAEGQKELREMGTCGKEKTISEVKYF